MSRNRKRANIFLWGVQVVLSLLFLFAGGMKLILPLAALNQGPILLPGLFLRAIGVLEVLGGLGLVLPGVLRLERHLVPLAAAGLVGIMAGATTLTALSGTWVPALFPFTVGGLALVVCVGRRGSLPPAFERRTETENLVPSRA